VPDPQELSREELVALVREQAREAGRLRAENTGLRDKNAELQGENTELRGRNAELRTENTGLRAENATLRTRVDRLQRLLSRNSANSSMPPSIDDLPGRTPPAVKPAASTVKRKRGKQRGAAGAHLAWREDPDDTVPHFPQGTCGCGAALADGEDLGVARSHQQYEVPRMSATCVQHDLHAVLCGCGQVHIAKRPEDVADTPVGYGPNLQSWCVYLLVAHAIPAHRCVQLVTALTGAAPSVGWAHGLLARTAARLGETTDRVRALLAGAHAVCCDETPIRVGPRRTKKYLLVACTDRYTYYHLGDRSLDTFKDFGLHQLTGVVVHDRYQNYDSKVFAGLVHQLCTAHLLRDLEDAAECYPHAVWPKQIGDALRDLIHAANTARTTGVDVDPELRATRIEWIRAGVAVGLAEVDRNPDPKGKQPPGRCLLEVLRDRRDDVVRFAYDLDVPPTSNQAERDVRPAKTQQKISGRLTSEAVTQARYRIRGYISTAAKHGIDQLNALRNAILGDPWMPPARAPT
jgi:transposase